MRVGIITCRQLPEPDPDAAPLDAALRQRGHTPVLVPWDDPDNAPEPVDLLVLRSPWNYHERADDFLKWIEQAAARTPMVNTPAIVRWNIHKGYLLQLAAAGVPIVPTRQIRRGRFQKAEAEALLAGSGAAVVKPAIGAGSVNVKQFQAGESAAALGYLEELSARCDALLQPCLDGFRDPGERSLIWIDGMWTHAIRKRPRFAGQDEQVEASPTPDPEELAVAKQALAAAPAGCVYARADVVRDQAGKVVLSELELVEPSLYFHYGPVALERFVGMLERRSASRQ